VTVLEHGSAPTTVVFDLGNVLIAYDPAPAIAAGVGEDEARRFLTAADFSFADWNHGQDAGQSWVEAERLVAGGHPHWLPHATAYREHFALALTSAIEPNVAVLERLHAAGIPCYALSNWSAETFSFAEERFGFLSLFDDMVISGREGLAKPDPRLFAVLQQRIGRPLAECVFVDDVERNVDAAHAAGMRAIRFTPELDLAAELHTLGLRF